MVPETFNILQFYAVNKKHKSLFNYSTPIIPIKSTDIKHSIQIFNISSTSVLTDVL